MRLFAASLPRLSTKQNGNRKRNSDRLETRSVHRIRVPARSVRIFTMLITFQMEGIVESRVPVGSTTPTNLEASPLISDHFHRGTVSGIRSVSRSPTVSFSKLVRYNPYISAQRFCFSFSLSFPRKFDFRRSLVHDRETPLETAIANISLQEADRRVLEAAKRQRTNTQARRLPKLKAWMRQECCSPRVRAPYTVRLSLAYVPIGCLYIRVSASTVHVLVLGR